MTRVVNGTKLNRWTQHETKQLIELLHTSLTYEQIARALNKSRASITTKIYNCRGVLHIPERKNIAKEIN